MNECCNQVYLSQAKSQLTITDPAKAPAPPVTPAKLSFTYFPHSDSLISAVKLTERRIEQRDVLTMYYPPESISFTGSACQSALAYACKDMIFNGGPEHKPQLHKPEHPTTQTDPEKGYHCHIKVARKQISPFIRQLFYDIRWILTEAEFTRDNLCVRCIF